MSEQEDTKPVKGEVEEPTEEVTDEELEDVSGGQGTNTKISSYLKNQATRAAIFIMSAHQKNIGEPEQSH